MKLPKQAGPLAIGILAVLLMLALRGLDPVFLMAQRASGFDTLQRLWPRDATEGIPIRIVDIDEKSISRLGQWPWPRKELAKLVNELSGMGVAAIAFDIVFPEEDRMSPARLLKDPAFASLSQSGAGLLPDFDQEFSAAISGKPVVLAFARGEMAEATDLPSKAGFAQIGAPAGNAPPLLGKVTANIPSLQAAAAGLGNINIDLASQQGIAREMPMLWTDGQRFLPSLGVEALRIAQGTDTYLVHADDEQENAITSLSIGALEIPLNENGTFPLYYRPNPPDMYVSAADIIAGSDIEKLRPLLEGHIVLVGTSAVGLLDSRTTPLGEAVPGVSIHAQALEQILAGQFLARPEWVGGIEIAMASLLSLFTVLAAAMARPAISTIVAALSAASIVGFTAFAFRQLGLLIDVTFPLLMLVVTFLAATAYRLLVTDRLGRQMRHMFGRYVAPSVLAELEKNPESLKLGGEIRDVTVLFLDIANFTPLSEKLKPDELVAVVNGLWDHCSKAILAENGTIDKFIGDAIMAFWNAPVACPDHQYRACKAALGVRAAVKTYNDNAELRRRLEPKGLWPLGVRVGLASGEACVGNMGSTERFDYSVIGETVNTAARAESACKHVAHDILLAGIIDRATERLAILPAGHVHLKGRSLPQPVTIIVGDETEAKSAEFQALVKEHQGIVSQLSTTSKKVGNGAVLEQLVSELSLHNPALASYLTAITGRAKDFQQATASALSGHVKPRGRKEFAQS
jgi:adenylate cyclase